MATQRISTGLQAIREAGFAVLARRVEEKLATNSAMRRNKPRIENSLSLGGFRGGIRKFKSQSKTDRRTLARGVILAHHVLAGDPIANLKTLYKNQSTDDLKAALTTLDRGAGEAATRGISRAMQHGMVGGKAYHYQLQQTHTDFGTTDAGIARARGFVPQTNAGGATGRFVAVDGGDSCGPTALAIAYYYVKGTQMSEGEFRGLSSQDGEGWQTGGVGSGTNSMQSLVRTGRSVGLNCGDALHYRHAHTTRNWLRQHVDKKAKKVAILNVGWHFTVAVDIVSTSDDDADDVLICADPWFRIVETPMADLMDYNAPNKALNGWFFSIK